MLCRCKKRKKNPAFVYSICVALESFIKFVFLLKKWTDNCIFPTISYFSVVTFETLSDDYSKVRFIALVFTACPQEVNEWDLFLR